MNLIDAIQSVDMENVINRMNLYAISRLKSVGLKDFNGKEPIDFVSDVILKTIEDKRSWNDAKCTFTEFLFGCLRSEISNFFDRYNNFNKYIHVSEYPEISINANFSDTGEARKQISELLISEGADDDEQIVFEYWMDGIVKPSEIAKDLCLDVKEIYKITKRLERRLPKIQKQAINIV
jgi:hypothetical protein